VAQLLEDQPTVKPVLLTLTQANVPVEALGDELVRIHAAWHRLTKRRDFPSTLGYRRTEITVSTPESRLESLRRSAAAAKRRQEALSGPSGNASPTIRASKGASAASSIASQSQTEKKGSRLTDNGEVTLHPHLHCLLFVRASYFGRDYIKQADWTEKWRQCLGIDYSPVVDIRRAYQKGSEGLPSEMPLGAAMEVSKYITKQSDLPSLGPLVAPFSEAVRGVRMRAVSRPLSRYISAAEVQAAELLDSPLPEAPGGSPIVRVVADWCGWISAYLITPSEGGA